MKKIIFSTFFVLVVVLIGMGIYATIQTRELALDVRQTILNKENFTGQTKDQILERFRKPKKFQNIFTIDKDGTSHKIEMLFYFALGIDMCVYLDNGIVTDIEYSQEKNDKRVTFTIHDISVSDGQIEIINKELLPTK